MSQKAHNILPASIAAALSMATLLIPAQPAGATEIDDVRSQLEAAQEEYNAVQDEQTAIQGSIDEMNQKIEGTREHIRELRSDLAEQAVWEYKNGGAASMIELLVGARDFSEFIEDFSYLEVLGTKKANLITENAAANTVLAEQIGELDGKRKQAAESEAKAKEIVDSISGTLEEFEAEQRQIYGYQGGGPVSEIPASGSVVDYARSRIGCPYVWGAAGPEAFDCSGLVMWAYAQTGRYLPHQSEAQYAAADEIVPLSEARPGDVLWRYGHVGICTGYGASSYVHAPNFGEYVREGDPVGWSGFTCALRFN